MSTVEFSIWRSKCLVTSAILLKSRARNPLAPLWDYKINGERPTAYYGLKLLQFDQSDVQLIPLEGGNDAVACGGHTKAHSV